MLWVTERVLVIFAFTYAKCYTLEDIMRKETLGVKEDDRGGIPMLQVAWIWSEEIISTESALTPASWTFTVNPEVMKFYPFNVAVGLVIEIDVTEG